MQKCYWNFIWMHPCGSQLHLHSLLLQDSRCFHKWCFSWMHFYCMTTFFMGASSTGVVGLHWDHSGSGCEDAACSLQRSCIRRVYFQRRMFVTFHSMYVMNTGYMRCIPELMNETGVMVSAVTLMLTVRCQNMSDEWCIQPKEPEQPWQTTTEAA